MKLPYNINVACSHMAVQQGFSCDYFPGLCQNPFWGISRNPFQGISCNPYKGISWNPFWGISHNPIWGISHNQFQEISLENNPRKCWPNLGKFLVISRDKFFRTNSWEFPGNYSLEFPKSSSEISQDIFSIFLSKFTNQGYGSIVVNILTTIYVATPFV